MGVTSSIKNTWRLIEKFKDETSLLMDENALVTLIYIWRHNGIESEKLTQKLDKHIKNLQHIIKFLEDKKFLEEKNEQLYITQKGKGIVDIIEYSQYKIEEIPENIIPGYVLIKPPIGCGSTSFTFRAEKKGIRNKVIKVFKPGLFDHIDFKKKIEELQPLYHLRDLVLPEDFGDFEWNGNKFKYIVMRYVEGITLKEFLNKKMNIDLRKFLENFIQEVGKTLLRIEEVGANHGDLHSNNILVVEDPLEKEKSIYHFQIIDFIGIKSNEEFKEFEVSDFEYFKQHLLRIVKAYAFTPSGEPDRKKLGEKLYYVIKHLPNYHSFKEFFDVYSNPPLSPNPELGKKKEPPFSFIRFEQYDINDPLWLRRFEPDEGLYAKIKEFDNTICSGPRGCGKTIYLRSLSFVPRLIKLINDNPEKYSEERKKIAFFDNIFGIYFACRQGEFKYFSETQFDFKNSKTLLFIKHIIVLRIIKSTLKLIYNAYYEELFNSEPKIEEILKFLKNYLLGDRIILIKEEHKNPFGQLVEIIGEEENYCEKLLDNKRYPHIGKMLNEHKLIEFFNILKKSIPEIWNMKFYIIFDDISEPQVPVECQKIINSLMACLNETYCCKFSTEKFAYTYVDMYGKTLQSTNDYTYIDLSFIGSFEDRYTEKEYKNYLERIINRRLNVSGFKRQINEILETLPYPTQTLINWLSEYARGNTALRNKIKFAGWDLTVQLSSRSVRDAIAICDFIFREYESLKDNIDTLKESKEKISVDIQNRAIKKYSIQEYKGLVNISYYGKEVFNIVRNFGEISRHFLKREITKERGRKYEVITIERTDAKELSENAVKILRTLIRYSVFLDRGLSFSREQIGLVEKLTLHKKFTPALMTTYREREHLRLSKDRLEKFILKPDKFREELLTGKALDKSQLKLFDFMDGDKNE